MRQRRDQIEIQAADRRSALRRTPDRAGHGPGNKSGSDQRRSEQHESNDRCQVEKSKRGIDSPRYNVGADSYWQIAISGYLASKDEIALSANGRHARKGPGRGSYTPYGKRG